MPRDASRENFTYSEVQQELGVGRQDVHTAAAKREILLRTVFVFLLQTIFAFAVIYSIWIVRCVSYGTMHLSDKVVLSLVTATVAEIAGMLYWEGKYLFPSDEHQSRLEP
jgi:hypothetical protein